MLVCGDFNIDLLQHETHDCVRQFLDLMYSIGLYPLITKPTRISQNTATLIDNIFTTDIEQHYTCGLLINDISDHLPIFTMEQNINKNKAKKKHNTKWVRQTKEENINSFHYELQNLSWETVLNEEDVNKAYATFISNFTCILDKYLINAALDNS